VASVDLSLPSPSTVPFIGREKERAALTKALANARAGKGQAWLIEGAAGIGKTRLVRWLEQEALKSGFRVLWGYCQKESTARFFPFQEIFGRSIPSAPAPAMPAPSRTDAALPVLTIFEDEQPLRLLERAADLSISHPCLVVSQEQPSQLRGQLPYLAPDARVLQLAKGGESDDCLPAGHVNVIRDRLSQHLKSSPGAIVALTNLDYLVSQNGFEPVLSLVQSLREEAERTKAHVLFSVNPATLGKGEMALLKGEGEFIQQENTAPSESDPPAMTMLRYLETLERDAPRQPRLLVIDDVQWADPDSLRTLQFLARNIRNLPVLLVGTMRAGEWRTPEERMEQVVDDILGKTDEEGSLFRLTLHGLGDDESQDLAERMVGLPLQKGEGAAESPLLDIFRRAQGNPFFVQETMRQLVQEGLLRREGDYAVLVHPSTESGTATSEALPIPPTLRRLIALRLSMLTKEEMDLVRWASVAGSKFGVPPLAYALHRPEGDVSTFLRRLERNLHILESQPGGELWSFTNPLVREVTLAETDREERRQKALILADWWAEHRGDDVETAARLYHDAMEPGRGLPWVRKAVDLAISQHAPETVERYHGWLQDLLQLAGVDPESRLQEGMSICERHLLELGGGSALSHMLEFLANLPVAPEQRLPARILIAYTTSNVDARGVRAQMDAVNLEVSRKHGKLPLKWEVMRTLVNSNLLHRQGKTRAALEEFRRLSTVAGGVQEPWIRGRVVYDRGWCCANVGLVDEAKIALEELHGMAKTSHQTLLESFAFSLDSEIAQVEGDLRRTEKSEELSLTSSRQRGDVRNISIALSNLVVSAALRGDADAARTYFSESAKICGQFGLKDMVDYLFLVEGYIQWSEQRWAELVGNLTELFSRPVEDMVGRAFAHSFLAEAYVEISDLPSARACLAKTDEHREELDPGELANVLRVKARLEDMAGNHETARKTLADALRFLEEHPNMYWGAWVNAEMARWEAKHGDPARALSFGSKAESLFEKTGVLPAGRPRWLRDLPPPIRRT